MEPKIPHMPGKFFINKPQLQLLLNKEWNTLFYIILLSEFYN